MLQFTPDGPHALISQNGPTGDGWAFDFDTDARVFPVSRCAAGEFADAECNALGEVLRLATSYR